MASDDPKPCCSKSLRNSTVYIVPETEAEMLDHQSSTITAQQTSSQPLGTDNSSDSNKFASDVLGSYTLSPLDFDTFDTGPFASIIAGPDPLSTVDENQETAFQPDYTSPEIDTEVPSTPTFSPSGLHSFPIDPLQPDEPQYVYWPSQRQPMEGEGNSEMDINSFEQSPMDSNGYSHVPSSVDSNGYSHVPSSVDSNDYSYVPSSVDQNGYSHVPSSVDSNGYSNVPSSVDSNGYSHVPSSVDQTDYSHVPSSVDPNDYSHVPASEDPNDTENEMPKLLPYWHFQPNTMHRAETIEQDTDGYTEEPSSNPSSDLPNRPSQNVSQSSNWPYQSPESMERLEDTGVNAPNWNHTHPQNYGPSFSERTAFSTDDDGGFMHQEFSNDGASMGEEPLHHTQHSINHHVSGATREDGAQSPRCCNCQHNSFLNDDHCVGLQMYIWLLDCIHWLNVEVTKEPCKNALRASLIPLERAFNIIYKAQREFIKDLVYNGHKNHHPSYCNLVRTPTQKRKNTVRTSRRSPSSHSSETFSINSSQ